MCGICGIWGEKNESHLEKMKKKLHHRGPDASGSYKAKKGVLGHCRLAIMDLQNGNQPIFNENHTMAIVANGEIYNYFELYQKLAKRHHFATKSDSEVILHLYEELGVEVVNYLDGMFAFCIADGDSIFVARDSLGIKPLYYSIDDKGTFYFSSEIKGIRSVKKISEFPPGIWYHSKLGFKPYHKMPYVRCAALNPEIYVKNLQKTLEKAIRKRLMSDVPIGAFLSGGLDSSIITALAKKHVESLHTFCVGVKGCKDIENARNIAEHIESVHHEYIISPEEILGAITEIIYKLESFDQDLVRSAIPCYFVSKLASKYVKVVLTGEGADELFGGYQYYKKIDDENLLSQELRRSITCLHNINLQRVDRMTMAHSIEGRVPFLDLDMIELALTIPIKWKLYGDPPVEKWILRKSFENLLPKEVVWREKEQFDEGTGTVGFLQELISQRLTNQEAESYKKKNKKVFLRSVEECYYHKIFSEKFSNHKNLLGCIGRWSQRPSQIMKCL